MTYIKLLKEYPLIRKLSTLQLIAYFGSWFSSVAIYTMLVNFGSTAFAISMVTVMHLLPAVVIAPLSGAIIDKFKIKSLMLILLITELIMTLLILGINNKDEVWILMILIFLRMTSASVFFSAEMSLLPKIAKGIALQKANEIHSIIWSFTYAIGMGLSGIIVNAYGIKTAIIMDASIFIIAIIYFINIDFKIEVIHTQEKIIDMIKDGFTYIRKSKRVLQLIFLHASVGLTSFDTLVTLLAKNEYKYIIAVPLAIGITNALRALSLIIGPFILSNWINKDRLTYIFVLQGSCIIFWALVQHDFYLSLIAVFATGFCTTTIWSYTYVLLQDEVEEKYLGRVISYNDMIFMLSNVTSTLFVGIMASYLDLSEITFILGFAFFLVAIYYKKVIN